MTKRIYYSLKTLEINTVYELETCLCNCPDEHSENCPNKGKLAPLVDGSMIATFVNNKDGKEMVMRAKLSDISYS